ncbi:C4-dicarboxylate TRAP transporter substrate-binding protein [Stappia taiwanensis]|uniref:C4-dicarboxylate TRAP transporter substrate-binding protein n=1 Tax=Stappia taiwanensis TaxID=992267 RepID=A0A838XYR8_9HYPH|nr:C4-dicarboxylate TRAP transporter substrate-binding protein [Stappia taiwanensis]MBA4613678.1 C4-dicarboxylate TRAP transporter substrate-binding protein [Stappia taiwanensis]GGE81486.1 C4-dicarboxylate ABC transporter [Stappia taiwanensis]
MKKTLPIALAGLATLTTGAMATELTISSWVAPSHPTIFAGYETYFPAVEEATKGEVSFKLVSGGALLGGKETLTGLGDGVADGSVLALTYNPAQLPTSQLVAELAMLSGNSLAVAAAVTEFTLLNCQPCITEFSAQNVVYTGSYATAPYALISKGDITSLADIAGKRVRSPGGAWDRWITESGATVVHTSSSEMYEALDKGMIDVAMQPAAALKSHSLWDVANSITLGSFGVYNSGPLLSFNKDAWGELTPENRRVMLDKMALAIVATTEAYLTQNAAAKAEAPEHGVTLVEKPAKLEEEIAAFNGQDISAVIEKAENVYGVKDAKSLIESYTQLLAKWQGITSEVASREELVARMKADIFDKLSETDYGL